MDNNTILILGLVTIALCALIFYNRVSLKVSKNELSLDADNHGLKNEETDSKKPVADIETSKKVEIDQEGDSSAKIKGSEEIKIIQKNPKREN